MAAKLDIQKIIAGDTTQLTQLLNLRARTSEQSAPTDSAGASQLDSDALSKLLPALTALAPELAQPATADLNQQLPALQQTVQLTATLTTRLYFSIDVFQRYLQLAQLDPQLTARLGALLPSFVRLALIDDGIYNNRQHPLYRLKNINDFGRSWYAQDNPLSRRFSEQLETTITAINQHCLDNSNDQCLQSLTEQQQQLEKFAQVEFSRGDSASQRCRQTEIGAIRVRSAQQSVLLLLNQHLSGRRLPPAISEFLQGPWRHELEYTLINDGKDAPLWNQWQSLISNLGLIFVADSANAPDMQRLYDTVPPTTRYLEQDYQPQTCASADYRSFAQALIELLLGRIKGEETTGELVEAIPGTSSENTIKPQISASQRQLTQQLSEQDWFLFDGEQQTIRCRLALKLEEADQLLFVNRYGHKVLQKSFDDFALCLSAQIARPLAQVDVLEQALSQAIDQQVQEHRQALKQQKGNDQQQARQAAALKARKEAQALAVVNPTTDTSSLPAPSATTDCTDSRQAPNELEPSTSTEPQQQHNNEQDSAQQQALAEQARQAAESIAAMEQQHKQQLAEQARQAAEALATAKQQHQQQLDSALASAEQERQQQHAVAAVEQLRIGANIELIEQDKPLRCKLAVHIEASGKYIFVDRLGVKVAEYGRDVLIERFSQQQIRVLKQGEKFDDKLAKVIKNLRNPSNP